jgi:large conductance mechanosensitive channel
MDPIRNVVSRVAELDSQRAYTLFGEFKKFAFKGNVIDMAVGVIIGAAFGKIVDSLVKDIIMPVFSLILPADMGYQNWVAEVHGVTIPFGKFIGEVVNFLLIALVLFFFAVKFLGWIVRAKQAGPPLTKDQELLTEIRDLLKKNSQPAAQ